MTKYFAISTRGRFARHDRAEIRDLAQQIARRDFDADFADFRFVRRTPEGRVAFIFAPVEGETVYLFPHEVMELADGRVVTKSSHSGPGSCKGCRQEWPSTCQCEAPCDGCSAPR